MRLVDEQSRLSHAILSTKNHMLDRKCFIQIASILFQKTSMLNFN